MILINTNKNKNDKIIKNPREGSLENSADSSPIIRKNNSSADPTNKIFFCFLKRARSAWIPHRCISLPSDPLELPNASMDLECPSA